MSRPSTLTMKFGGSSVGTTSALTQVLSIVLHEHQRWDRLVLIVSALEGVTDMLLEAAHLAQVSNQRGYRRIAATLRNRHLGLVEHLPFEHNERIALQADIDRLLFEMLDLCQQVANAPSEILSPKVSDSIICVGERLAARIIAALLRQNGLRGVAIDGTDIIVTDHVHGNATPLVEPTREKVDQLLLPMLDRQIIPVITGFIGATMEGDITTLGRGGSDYSASILSVCINAHEMWVWSDVDGMMTTDPREIETARSIPTLSYDEVAELAYFGARILHARMIHPLKERQMPLRIKNVYKPQQPGTLVGSGNANGQPRVQAVTSIQGIGLSANRSGSLAKITQMIDDLLFENTGSRANVTISSQSSSRSFITFVVPTSVGVDAVSSLQITVEKALSEQQDDVPWQAQTVVIVTAVGDRLDQNLGITSKVLSALENIPVIGIATGPSQCSLSIIIEPQYADRTLRAIHELALKSG